MDRHEAQVVKLLAAFLTGLVAGTYISAYILEYVFPPDPFPASTSRERIQWSRTPAT
jgi:hypothetical protein